MARPLKFKATQPNDFSKVLRKRVRAYFEENQITTDANSAMMMKTFIHLTIWFGSYLLLILGDLPIGLQYLLWAVLGFSIAMVAMNIGHDAIHGAYTRKPWLKKLLAHTFNLNGASAYMWNRMHNVAHHTYTNIHGWDEDVSPIPIIRLSPDAELKKVHRYQHYYSYFFYSLATISWVFIKDYKKFFENTVGNFSNLKHPPKEYFFLFFYKFLNYFIFLGLPLLVIDLPWYHIVLGFLIMHAIAGFILAVIFMLAHAVEAIHFPRPAPTGIIENDWAIHQLVTTANFSTGSKVANFFTGGLNQQIEHHLFPDICSIHYTALAPIVKQTAEEFGVPYYEAPNFLSAIASHIRFLRRIGRDAEYRPKIMPAFA